MKMTQDEKYMKAAIREAKKAYALDEVPIGCVIVQDGTIIARGYNRRNTEGNTLAHAELTAIKKASKKTGDWLPSYIFRPASFSFFCFPVLVLCIQ